MRKKFFQEQITSDCCNFLLGQDNMLCEWEESSRRLVCFEIVSLHARTTQLRKFVLAETNRKLCEKLGIRLYCILTVPET